MKVVIAGSRHIKDKSLLLAAILESGFDIDCIIHGDATGADRLGKQYADENQIPQVAFPADWEKNGKAAGPIRNSEMIDYVKKEPGNGLIALWDGKSRGTFDVLKKAFAAKLRIYVKTIPQVT